MHPGQLPQSRDRVNEDRAMRRQQEMKWLRDRLDGEWSRSDPLLRWKSRDRMTGWFAPE